MSRDSFASIGVGEGSPDSPPPNGRRTKSFVRRVERCCCGCLTYFPLVFVIGLTSWAVWVEAGAGFAKKNKDTWIGPTTSWIGILLYTLLNSSYLIAVFTDPGSPLETTGYTSLPTQEEGVSSVTVKSTGEMRFCKKCRSKKPDRTHHCSTCGRCVLKMDHHCPWLATCVGLKNYKPFLLFLVYTTLFCWICFLVCATWVFNNILDVEKQQTYQPVNFVLLAVLAGIIGLVLAGFTAWHLYLTCTGQTTIESLEKTRYLTPLRKTLNTFNTPHRNPVSSSPRPPTSDPSSIPAGRPSIGDQLREIHANALPGVLRPEEGDSHSPSPSPSPYPHPNSTPASRSLHNSYAALEARRERARYSAYLDEEDSSKLPHAFDLGLRRNLIHVFGPSPLFWGLPVCNTTGDGWRWEPSNNWVSRREEVAREREDEMRRQRQREREAGWGVDSPMSSPTFPPGYHGGHHPYPPPPNNSQGKFPAAVFDGATAAENDSRYLTTSAGVSAVPNRGRRSPRKADMILGRAPGSYSDAPPSDVQLSDLRPRQYDPTGLDDLDDEGWEESAKKRGGTRNAQTENWNDLPEDMLNEGGRQSRGRSTQPRQRDGEWDDWGQS